MAIPFSKFIALGIRVFSFPVIEGLKKAQKVDPNRNQRITQFFIWVGNKHYRIENKLNRHLMKIKTEEMMFEKPLTDDIALERGINWFYSFFFYFFIISFICSQVAFNYYRTLEHREVEEKMLLEMLRNAEDSISEVERVDRAYRDKLTDLRKEVEDANRTLDRILCSGGRVIESERRLMTKFGAVKERYKEVEERLRRDGFEKN